MRRRPPELASLWRRVAAAFIDAGIFLPLIGLGAVAWVKVPPVLPRLRRKPRSATAVKDEAARVSGPPKLSAAWRFGTAATSTLTEVGLRNWRTPGARLMGIRRVDANTGGPVSLRGVVRCQLLMQLWGSAVTVPIQRRAMRRHAERTRAVAPLVERAEQQNAGDREAVQRAVMGVYREHNITLFGGCLWPLVSQTVVTQLPALWSPQKQTLPDRLAGAIVVKA